MKRRSSEMAAFFCSRKLEILPFSVTLSITIFFCWLRQAQPTKKGFPLPSWLKFTGSFSFHSSKLPRQNFLRKFRHPISFRSSQWQGNFCKRSQLWKQSTLASLAPKKSLIKRILVWFLINLLNQIWST